MDLKVETTWWRLIILKECTSNNAKATEKQDQHHQIPSLQGPEIYPEFEKFISASACLHLTPIIL
jgi:hypothetical protein